MSNAPHAINTQSVGNTSWAFPIFFHFLQLWLVYYFHPYKYVFSYHILESIWARDLFNLMLALLADGRNENIREINYKIQPGKTWKMALFTEPRNPWYRGTAMPDKYWVNLKIQTKFGFSDIVNAICRQQFLNSANMHHAKSNKFWGSCWQVF